MNEDSVCPIEKTLNLLNKKWNIQIIRDLFFGKKYFKEFKESNKNITNKVLSNCLKELESNNLIKKNIINNTPEYILTELGRSLNKIIYELAMFTLENDESYYDLEKREEMKKLFKMKLKIK